ncbi:PREDICTED: uncharacterized protein LOC108801514 [Nanorana parkeri]|uniref:uncharacterized protein LOC108801514 n=1 Tax=Nanorana parkeri TaxID=125878 RepID=UPI000854AEE3|nr:PREDICTED: uncharacterized protein LOC108801514 [Nanorana parkeri]
MPKCIFRSCPHFLGKNCFSPGITLHVFPRDLGRIKLWLQRTGQYYDDVDDIAETILSSKAGSYRMCSAHFVPECYTSQGTKEVLKPDAVPTVFPGNVVEVAIKHVPQKKKQRLEEREARRRARWTQVDAGTSTVHIIQTEMGTQTDLTTVTIQPCSLSVPRGNTIDRGVQWPEYEFNFYGEDWKVQLDHMYFNSRFKCIQELPNMDQEEIMKDRHQAPSTAQPHGSSQEEERVTRQEPRKAESETGTSPETPEGYFFSKCSLRNKKTLCILQAKLVDAMPKCIFRSCPHFLGKNCFSPGITLHVFPRDLGRIKLWLQRTGQYYDDVDDIAETILSSKAGSYRMCSAHFVPECYTSQGTKEVLKPDAVPTVFPGNVVEVAIKHVPQKKKQRLEEREARRRARWTQVDAGTSTVHIIQTEMGTQTDLTTVTIQPCSLSVPRGNTIDRGVQWPEYEFNFYGEDWKVQLDHMYFNSRFKCIQELPNMDQEEIMKDRHQAPSTAQPHGSSQEEERVTRQEPRKAESETGTSPETPEGYFFSKCSLRNKKTLCILQAKLVALLRHMTEAPHMGSYKRQRTRKLLSQIVEIVCLVAGEDLKLVKKNEDLSKFYQKEGEIPVRYQDVAVFFTRDEWNYIEENEELYKKEILSDPNESKEDQVEDFIDDFEEGAEITDDHFFKLLEVNTQGHSPGAAPVGRKRKKMILPTMPGIAEDAAGGREHGATDWDYSPTCKSEYFSGETK